MAMTKQSVESFSEFVSVVEGLGDDSDLLLFRGQPLSGKLIPRIARKNPREDTGETEKQLLHQLRRLGAALLSSPEPDDWDLLVWAQHFGMATRLLDWSANPLVALWFACADPLKDTDVYVYALKADSLVQQTHVSPFQVAKTRVFQPRLNNPRIVAQLGWFTAHRYSLRNKRWIALENNPEVSSFMTEVHIPDECREDMLRALSRHGVSARTIYPDLSGLCTYLNWKFGAK